MTGHEPFGYRAKVADSYEERFINLIEAVLYLGFTAEQLAEYLEAWTDSDEIRALSQTTEHIRRVARDVWYDRVTKPKDAA